MAGAAKKSDPKLWEKVKAEVTASDRGGNPGQWSARKAQMAVRQYKEQGGEYEGAKTADNHLVQWTEEEWGTKSGQESGKTGERYLPKEARDHLTDDEYRRTTQKKRRDTKAGRQFSAQPKDVAEKTAHDRHHETGKSAPDSKAALYAEAKRRNIPGRSSMSKADLAEALR